MGGWATADTGGRTEGVTSAGAGASGGTAGVEMSDRAATAAGGAVADAGSVGQDKIDQK